jgi:hypothetical protein
MNTPSSTKTTREPTAGQNAAALEEAADAIQTEAEGEQKARAAFANDIAIFFNGWRSSGMAQPWRAESALNALEAINGARGIASVLQAHTSTQQNDRLDLLSGPVLQSLQDGLHALLKFSQQYIEQRCKAAGVEL